MVWSLSAAVAASCALVAAHRPAAGFPGQPTRFGESLMVVVAMVVATGSAMLLVRHWPWLVAAGAVLTFGWTVAAGLPELAGGRTYVGGLRLSDTGPGAVLAVAQVVGPALVLVGVLGGELWLCRAGWAAGGAAVAGVAVGAQLLGPSIGDFQQSNWLADHRSVLLVLAAVALMGGLAAAAGWLRGPLRPWPLEAGDQPDACIRRGVRAAAVDATGDPSPGHHRAL
jgi:hypothetical protein